MGQYGPRRASLAFVDFAAVQDDLDGRLDAIGEFFIVAPRAPDGPMLLSRSAYDTIGEAYRELLFGEARAAGRRAEPRDRRSWSSAFQRFCKPSPRRPGYPRPHDARSALDLTANSRPIPALP